MTVPASQGLLQAGPEPDRRFSGILARGNCRNCHAPAPGCRMLPRGRVACGNCHSRGNEYGGPSADFFGSFPPLFAKASATNASAFTQFPQARRRFQHPNPEKEDRANKPGLWRQELRP